VIVDNNRAYDSGLSVAETEQLAGLQIA